MKSLLSSNRRAFFRPVASARTLRLRCLFLLVSFLSFSFSGYAAEDDTETLTSTWVSGRGEWDDASHWNHGVPSILDTAIIRGDGDVIVSSGQHLVGQLIVGPEAGDRARVEINGGQLINRRAVLRLGDDAGASGELDLNAGALHSFSPMEIGGPKWLAGHETTSTLRIRGGDFLVRGISLGFAPGSNATVSIEGSKATSISLLDNFLIKVDTLAGETRPGTATLAFTLDEHGVTPIELASPQGVLQFLSSGVGSRIVLKISLSAPPPVDDITLVACQNPPKGTFTDLPEGSPVTADFKGKTYRWKLTYRGGPRQSSVALLRDGDFPADTPVTHTLPVNPMPPPLWEKYPVYELPARLAGPPAFPGAEGFGSHTPGGAGGQTIDVDNLDDSGPGSLRAALETRGPRVIHFRVGGMIDLKTPLSITEPFVTIDGESAPGPGILIRYHGLTVATHDVILRYLRIRPGDDASREKIGEEALYLDGVHNCIVDHLSLSWATTKILSVVKNSDLITIQWCLVSEALNFRQHGFASLAGGGRVTWHHNLFAHNLSRNVRWQELNDTDFRNNVIYDWGTHAGYGEFDRINYVGNYLKPGPSTTQAPPYFHNGDSTAGDRSFYVDDNLIVGHPEVRQDNWLGVNYPRAVQAREPFPAPPVTTEAVGMAYEHVLNDAGATLPQRDTVDRRIVQEVRAGTGHIINSIQEVGGWEDFPSASN